MTQFTRVLIANRGEIAVRVIRALRTMGIEAVAVYSDADSSAMHVTMADRSHRLPGIYAAETYLNKERILEIARQADCDAIHPGYGFLAESSEFSEMCRDISIKFIGPKPETLDISGNKLECKKLVESKGVPVIPYIRDPLSDVDQAVKYASEVGFPVLLKSAFGGGGRGIREAKNQEEVKQVFESTQREAKSAFGKFAIYVEKKLVNPRHIEVQIIATDDSSEVVHLCERECSIQRRFQKLVELSPSPVVDEETREKITSYAILAAKALGYSNAGTIEMLRDSESGNFYFMEMNSRLQVEHPVTEFVTGVDLVCTQIKVAQGENLPFHQRDIKINGCAIECRINAENPLLDFAPTVGKVEHLHLPGGPGVRIDSAIYEGAEIPPYYDSMIAKLIVWARSFDGARERGIAALEEFSVAGLDTTIPFHLAVLRNEKFARGEFDTSFIDTSGVREQIAQAASRVDQEDYYFLSALLLSRNQFSEPSAKGGTETTTRRSPTWLRQEKGERFVDAV